ncbi:TonB-dependent receptor plug domain-containing protein [Helicobacter saguini]|uniref:TonB-dependent receptor n=1 Tax=Helicobacter saguini TaxID=1548018 RepID=A0A347VUN3_9HELI|nr:TonB-dependent receptor [Helicobacter saguini]MWV62765.1 TonB-dependent receptor plug domain-containing protein [Helicobacter saguini]MWV66565.1 TonB-dependent receptor plug domain-containing protein [Helicobacter saguini]MWV68915.1 TonB-dependent receptor plug domain-containing protein [Helicobacter saguini]MWV71531.1 TonB-dependent receptor plug domain-containing protein [Helicobacter saguini]TLD93628.1 TonB-dependent receptor [Helicobacter saguini]
MFLFLKDSKILFAGLFVFNLMNADSITQDKDSIESNFVDSKKDSKDSTLSPTNNPFSENTESKTKNIKNYRLNAVTTISNDANKTYQSSSGFINQQMIESNPSGNGDIGSLLRILPNVQYDNSQLRSTTPGEIDPARISISGGLHYQNNFQLDGFNMNNDLDPAGATFNGVNSWIKQSGNSQGLAIDTSLLESITILDSNVGAAYGGFTGGVIEANTRRPTKKFGANISYQITQGNVTPNAISMTNYHIYGDDSNLQSFINSNSESNQPIFIKHLVKSSIESKISDKFGFLASFTTTQSFIPLYTNPRSTNNSSFILQSSIDNKQTQKRQIYNYFLKGFYDINENVRMELSYIYAPQSNYFFMTGSKDDWYSLDSGGQTIGLKTIWDNPLGVLTNTLSYSYLESSSTAHGYSATKYWYPSASKNWAGMFSAFVREGGNIPYNTSQHTINNKIIQDFKPYEIWKSTHRFQVGLDLAYQYANYTQQPFEMALNNGNLVAIENEAQQKLCTDLNWCDTNPVRYTQANGTIINWQYGQYIRKKSMYSKGNINIDNFIAAFFIEDNILFDLGKFGSFNFRPGLRVEYDTYMNKVTLGHRISLNYEAPWNKSELGKNFQSQLTAGVNRYYGRNIFAYALADGIARYETGLRRNGVGVSWDSVLNQNRICQPRLRDANGFYHYHYQTGQRIEGEDYDNCVTKYTSDTKFTQLKVPYVDEYMIGFAQSVYDFNIGAKYICRLGRDEIRRITNTLANIPKDSNYADTYYIYTNEGKSTTHVITLSVENKEFIEFFGIKNHFLFAFDWTQVRRNYTDYTDTLSNPELANQWISYNGELLRYADRPADNFNRPYTIRLNTTHIFSIWKTKILWNNFFRFRSSYIAMASTPASYGGVANRPQPDKDSNGNYVDTFRPFNVKGAFTWDMRFGFEINAYKGNSLYVNVDIYNLLDSKNLAIASASYSLTAGTTATPIYEVGRQFWLTLGYKF